MTDEESTPGAPAEPIQSEASSRFERKSKLGEGGMGEVRLGFDHLMLRQVALKSLRGDVRDPKDQEQFVHEARLTAQLEHGNIVPVYDLRVDDETDSPSLIMKYVDGDTYQDLIEQLHASPADDKLYEALRVFLKVCDAISFAHERGVIHCDLKPGNVMVGKHGQVHVMDWGVATRKAAGARPNGAAKAATVAADRTDQRVFGTLSHMAPEQLQGDHSAIGPTTDIYGLGGLLCVLITGEAPRGDVEDVADTALIPSFDQRRRAIEVPPELCRIAEKALNPVQAYRYQTVDEMKAEMEAFMLGGGWFETQHYLAGDVILREGDLGSEAFIITSGVCDVFKDRPDGQRELLRSMGPGETFGELAVLMRRRRSASVIAQTDVSLRVVTPDALNHELERNPVLAAFLSAVTTRFCELEARLDADDE